MSDNTLHQQAATLGISLDYHDVDGGYHRIDDETLLYFTQLLSKDLPLTDEECPCYDAVTVLASDKEAVLSFELTLNRYQLFDETQQLLTTSILSVPSNTFTLPALSLGYYTLVIYTADNEQQRHRLIIAPKHCYQPPALGQHQYRGVNLQLYSLRSPHDADNTDTNWGIGDFADLAEVIRAAGELGLDFIGINPLHALYPAEPEWASPYSPASRRWQQGLYLSLSWIPEFSLSTTAQRWLAKQQPQIQQLRASEHVDYTAVNTLKMQALRLAFTMLETATSPALKARHDAFLRFITAGGEALKRHSTFHALNEKFHTENAQTATNKAINKSNVGWENWATDYQNPQHPTVQQFIRDNDQAIRFHSYLQWLLDEQLQRLQNDCLEQGLSLGIYGDLAVGTARGSAETWSHPNWYWVNAAIGAPPDPLGPVGQNWQLPPINPNALTALGFQPWISLLRANMKYCGALRIDHVMGLYRLWLIPEGKTAADGAYVHYPFEALMAITAIESQRARCLVIGEDLGTVPDVVRETLHRYRLLSYDVLYFGGCRQLNCGTMRWRPSAQVKTEALSVIGTHDLPPLRGWWHCQDLQTLSDLGILHGAALQQKYDDRLHDKQALLNALKAEGFLPENYHIDALTMAMHPQLNDAIHAYALAGNAHLFGFQLENYCEMETAFNVPGTTDEVPNWRHKLPEPATNILQRLPLGLGNAFSLTRKTS